ncbi:MAG TPA: MASE3 domain-containing protein [Armatimonadota bacterium]|nr:MASE3 domain-containing protein [Armatimonadota bacterium]
MSLARFDDNEQTGHVLLSPIAAIILSVVGLTAVVLFESFTKPTIPGALYVPLHTIMEFGSIVVSYAVFVVGWYAYRQTYNRRDLLIAVAFLAVGTIDFIHTLSYRGMPDFLGVNTVGKAAAYWLVARLLSAVALLAAAFITPTSKGRWIRPGVLMPAFGTLIIAVIVIFTGQTPLISGLMYTTGQGLTLLKIVLEYIIIAIYIAAFVALGRTYMLGMSSIRLLQSAIIFAVTGEICFTLYLNAYDVHNLLGHIYKMAAYYLVLQALFVSSLYRPFRELSQAKLKLEQSFSSIGEALGAGLGKVATLEQVSSLARQMFDADVAAIGEIRADGSIEIGSFDGINPGTFSVPLNQSIIEEAFVNQKPVVVHDVFTRPFVRKELIDNGIRGLMSAPIVRDGRPVGAIYVGSKTPGRFSSEDAQVLTGFARHTAIALANAEHYEREHRIAETLQKVIFPPVSMDKGSFRIAGKYQPAWDEAQVGGDFYDFFDLNDGRLAITIGDVSGKGLDAAVHTAIVKYSFQAYMREGMEPAEALRIVSETFKERVNRGEMPDNVFITLFCAIVDTKTGRVVYANAGHEPPIKISSGPELDMLEPTGPILGIWASEYSQSEVWMEPGDVLVFYTDGITEARTGGIMFGLAGLVDAVRNNIGRTPQELADAIYEDASQHAQNELQDDVALIVLQRSNST